MIPEFVPIETDNGMSVITAMAICCLMFTGGLFVRYFWIKQNEHGTKMDDHDKMINDIRVGMASLTSDVKSTRHIVENIERSMADHAKIYQQAMINTLRK